MKFLLDANTEYRLALFLKKLGHDVTAIATSYPPGLPDEEVLAIAYNEQRILLTNDRGDFGELIFHRRFPHYGVILFRLRIGDIAIKEARLHQVLTEHGNQLRNFIVITPKRIRIRKSVEKQAA